MPIAIFDIDGTLTDTAAVDVECYERAIREELGIEVPDDWPEMDEVTDSAILVTACTLLGRPRPDPATERRIAARVGALLEDALRDAPERFLPLPGARDVLPRLRDAGWSVGVATGAWRPSALVKLRAGGIRWEGAPLATSTDRPARGEIIRLAACSAGAGAATPLVYVGDGIWDGRAACALGCGFVGVGGPERAGALEGAGAGAVISDFEGADLSDLLAEVARTVPDVAQPRR